MGKVRTPTFRIESRWFGRQVSNMEWKTKEYGRPTTENIDRYVTTMEESMKPGGVNAHLGFSPILEVQIVRQSTGEVVASWERNKHRNEPAFQVV